MRRTATALCVTAVLALAAPVAAYAQPSPAARPAVPSTSIFGDVAGVPGTARAWVLGFTSSGSAGLLLHSAGKWTTEPRPALGKTGDLSAVAAGSAGTVWTAGYKFVAASHGMPPYDVPYVGLWGAGKWTMQDLPATDGEVNDIAASGANNAWAVGSMYTDSGYEADHWDGTSWTASALPDGTSLARVTTSGPGNAWALDTMGRVWSYDGTSWSKLPAQPKGSPDLVSIATAGADDTWVVGSDDKSGQFYAAQWTGSAWKQADIANPRTYGDLDDVSLTANTGWAVAHVSSGKPGGDAWLMLHLVNGTWHTQKVAGIGSSQLDAVDAVSAGSAYAVGSGDEGGSFAQYANGAWRSRPGPA